MSTSSIVQGVCESTTVIHLSHTCWIKIEASHLLERRCTIAPENVIHFVRVRRRSYPFFGDHPTSYMSTSSDDYVKFIYICRAVCESTPVIQLFLYALAKVDENCCKQTRASLPRFGACSSLSLQLYLTYHRILHMRVAVNSHALPVCKKNRITSLLCIFETTVVHLRERLCTFSPTNVISITFVGSITFVVVTQPIYLGVFKCPPIKTVLSSEWICLFDMDLKLKKNTATNGMTNFHNTLSCIICNF